MINPDFSASPGGLLPAIVQDDSTGKVLMLGYMNQEVFEQTRATGKVVFFSRSRNRAWVKGETSGNYLYVQEVLTDCDGDTILIKARPAGPVCHTGADTCFNEVNRSGDFLTELESVIRQRKTNPAPGSYTSSLFASGINRVAQKIGEEATELVIAAKDEDEDAFLNEAADLLFHFLVLLQVRGKGLGDVVGVLRGRQGVR